MRERSRGGGLQSRKESKSMYIHYLGLHQDGANVTKVKIFKLKNMHCHWTRVITAREDKIGWGPVFGLESIALHFVI